MTDLVRNLYVSYAADMPSEEDLLAQLEQFRQANALHKVTGLLLYHRLSYMQLIEGAPEAIEQLMKNIRANLGHYGIIELLNEPASDRLFPDWQMGFQRLDDDEQPAGYSSFMAMGQANAGTSPLPPQVWALLTAFSRC